MLLVVGTALGFLLAGSAFLVVRGLVELFRRRWKAAALRLLSGVALLTVTALLLAGSSYLLVSFGFGEGGTAVTDKARILASNISTLMNLSFLGMPFGALVGLIGEFRARRPPNQ